AMKPITRTARQNAHAAADGLDFVARPSHCHCDPVRAHGNCLGSRAAMNGYARTLCPAREMEVKTAAINHGRADTLAFDADGSARGAPKTGGLCESKNQMAREIEFVKGVEAQKTGAMHRRADDFMFFEQRDVMAVFG